MFKSFTCFKPFFALLAIVTVSLGGCTATPPPQDHMKVSLTEVKSAHEVKQAGKLHFEAGDYEGAAKSYFAALGRNASDPEARLGMAESYFKLGHLDKALGYYQAVLSVPGYSKYAMQGIGLVRLQQGVPGEAEEMLTKVVQEDPSLWRSWNGLAQIYDQRKDWAQSAAAYEHALEYAESPEFIYNNMGVSYMAQERFDTAAIAFKSALDNKPTLDVAKTNYKLALAMQDRYEESTIEHDVYEEAKALNNIGYTAMLRGDYEEAESLFLRAIDANPGFYEPPYRNLQVLYHLKRKQT